MGCQQTVTSYQISDSTAPCTGKRQSRGASRASYTKIRVSDRSIRTFDAGGSATIATERLRVSRASCLPCLSAVRDA